MKTHYFLLKWAKFRFLNGPLPPLQTCPYFLIIVFSCLTGGGAARGVSQESSKTAGVIEGRARVVATSERIVVGHGLSPGDVTNELAAARREFRRHVLEALREQCATDEEFAAESEALTG